MRTIIVLLEYKVEGDWTGVIPEMELKQTVEILY